jgi:prophage DNA circulation protein
MNTLERDEEEFNWGRWLKGTPMRGGKGRRKQAWPGSKRSVVTVNGEVEATLARFVICLCHGADEVQMSARNDMREAVVDRME